MKALTLFLFCTVSATSYAKTSKGTYTSLAAIAFKNPNVEKNIVFVHGTPGSADAFSDFVNSPDLRSKASLMSVDRLGFGKSSNKAETSLDAHTQSILKTLDSSPSHAQKTLCVGHSYGATLCLALAAKFPERFSKVILIAGPFNSNRLVASSVDSLPSHDEQQQRDVWA